MYRTILIAFVTLLISFGSYAQPQQPSTNKPQHPQQPPQMRSSEEMAKEQADMMNREVSLTSKQYKKVYKLFLKDFQYRKQSVPSEGNFRPQGGPGMMGGGPGGGMPGGGMMGGGPGGMPGGGMMGGGPGGPGGGMPPQGNFQGQAPSGMPQFRPNDDFITEEYLQTQDQKLKKILNDDQYSKWRAKHPAERLELPPLELE